MIGWSNDINVMHFIHSVGPYKAALALAFGIVLGMTFDTTGPRRTVTPAPAAAGAPTTVDRDRRAAADEPIARERRGFLRRPRRRTAVGAGATRGGQSPPGEPPRR